MLKATVLLVAILGASMSLTASAAEMVRYDYDRYQGDKAQAPNDDGGIRGEVPTLEKTRLNKRPGTKQHEYTSSKDKPDHPIFQNNGLMEDR